MIQCTRCNWRRRADVDTCPGCSGGYKVDGDKLRWDLLPSDALEQVARVLTYGANKYAERNWERGMKWSRPFGALMRHSWAWWRGQDLDPETGINHMAHAACCVMFLLAYALRKEMGTFDDRERLDLRDPRLLHKPTNPGKAPERWLALGRTCEQCGAGSGEFHVPNCPTQEVCK